MIRHGLEGFNLLSPLKNRMFRMCFPNDLPSRCTAIAATYTFKVEGSPFQPFLQKRNPLTQQHISVGLHFRKNTN